MTMLICIKQNLSNIWSSILEKLSNTEAELKEIVAYKKVCNSTDFPWLSLRWRKTFHENFIQFSICICSLILSK